MKGKIKEIRLTKSFKVDFPSKALSRKKNWFYSNDRAEEEEAIFKMEYQTGPD